tara:strand:+ start:105 stop:425 length:321 start_codon:yes stop_codon:yes gene_type:complete
MPMKKPKATAIHPYLNKLLREGIKTDSPIDPVLHSCCFKVNLESYSEHFQVKSLINDCEVRYRDRLIMQVLWLEDGAEFQVIHDCGIIINVMASVLNTLNELAEGN